MNYTALIVAAGHGTRMNLGYNKMFYELENHMTILDKTLNLFRNDERCSQIVLVMNSEDMVAVGKKMKWTGSLLMIHGGNTRQESVFNGLKGVKEDVVLIHDGARCYLEKSGIDACLNSLKSHDACLLTVPCKDTIKEVRDGKVVKTLDRNLLVQAQTPQAFKTELVFECYKKAFEAGFIATDDAQIVERYSDAEIDAVMGDYGNIKVTTMDDIK